MRAGLDKLLAPQGAAAAASGLRTRGGVFNLDMMRTVELEGMLDVALATAAGRAGAHRVARLARAHRLPDARRRALAQAHAGALPAPTGPRLEYKPVTLGIFEPQERKY